MNILLADDHQNMMDSLKGIIPFAFENNKKINFTESQNCESAVLEIKKMTEENASFDLAIIDYSMPADPENQIYNGGDICLFLQEKMPSCKTLIFTAHLEDFVLFEIDQNVKPDAIAIKSDVQGEDIITIVNQLVKGETYRSPYVLEKTKKMWLEEIFTHEINRKIVTLMSEGYRIKEIAAELHLSEVAIQKRVSKIKKALNITDDTTILREIKKRGYV